MELVLKRKVSLWEQVHQFFQTKGSNVFYEREQPIGASFDSIMEDIFTESGFKSIDCLTIVDKYFTNIKCKDAMKVAVDFLSWKDQTKIPEVRIYTQKRENCFENYLLEGGKGSILVEKKLTVHDRYWIFTSGDVHNVVFVGTSFNGFANGSSTIFYIAKVRDEHKEGLLGLLTDVGIDFVKKEDADGKDDR